MNINDLMICTGATEVHADEALPHLLHTMDRYEINTPKRQCAFLAQVGVESGGLKWLQEIWGPTDQQKKYEFRVDLGNTQAGDGYKYRGRGLIQITGRQNYSEISTALSIDFIGQPDLLSQYPHAAFSAGWFWMKHQLSRLADEDEFESITRRINGGLNGESERLSLWNRAKSVIV
jgi:putative chitinase